MTALYEIVPAGQAVDVTDVDPLRYQMRADLSSAANAGELATVKVRFKAPDGDVSRLLSMPVRNRVREMTPNVGFASAVAEFGMLLRESKHRGGPATRRS